MPARKEITPPAEPLGIVISNGDRDEPPPYYQAYVWGALPDRAEPASTKRMA